MRGIFQKENANKARKYGIYRHLPTYEKIIRNLVSFYTTKNNKANHGFGLKNVKRIVEKHNGTLDITYSEERFRINENVKLFL